jgi:hypothetical protein
MHDGVTCNSSKVFVTECIRNWGPAAHRFPIPPSGVDLITEKTSATGEEGE